MLQKYNNYKEYLSNFDRNGNSDAELLTLDR